MIGNNRYMPVLKGSLKKDVRIDSSIYLESLFSHHKIGLQHNEAVHREWISENSATTDLS